MSYENAVTAYEDAEVTYARRAIKNQSLTPWPGLLVREQDRLVDFAAEAGKSSRRERSQVIRERWDGARRTRPERVV